MKKILIATLTTLAFAAQAANFVQVEQENVQARLKDGSDSAVTYVRAGKDFGDYNVGLQGRTARFDNGGVATSLETYLSNKKVSVLGVAPFVGVGHDFGSSASRAYNYGLVGATTGTKVGPGYAMVGVKTRVGTNADDPKQTVGWVSYAYPVAKNVALTVGASRSGQDIKERGVSAGISIGF